MEDSKKQSESFYKEIVDKLKVSIFCNAIKAPPELLWASNPTQKHWGITLDEIIDKGDQFYLQLIQQEHLKEVYTDPVEKIMLRERMVPYRAVCPFMLPKGGHMWALGNATALSMDENGIPDISVCLAFDITSQIETDKNLQEILELNHALKFKLLLKKLSETEQEIAFLIAKGKTSKEVAEKTFRSLKTIETHRRNILKKLDCKNIAELTQLVLLAQKIDNQGI